MPRRERSLWQVLEWNSIEYRQPSVLDKFCLQSRTSQVGYFKGQDWIFVPGARLTTQRIYRDFEGLRRRQPSVVAKLKSQNDQTIMTLIILQIFQKIWIVV